MTISGSPFSSLSVDTHPSSTHCLNVYFMLNLCVRVYSMYIRSWHAKDFSLAIKSFSRVVHCTQDNQALRSNVFPSCDFDSELLLLSSFVVSGVCYFSAQPCAVGVKTHLTFPILLRYQVINNSDREAGEKAFLPEIRIPSFCLYLWLNEYYDIMGNTLVAFLVEIK